MHGFCKDSSGIGPCLASTSFRAVRKRVAFDIGSLHEEGTFFERDNGYPVVGCATMYSSARRSLSGLGLSSFACNSCAGG